MTITGPSSSVPTTGKNSLHILFVDDEEMLARMAGKLLALMGHTVDIFTIATEGLKCFTQQPESYDLVITDLTMPDMSGLELATSVKAINPHLPVILSTGFSELLNEQEAFAKGIDVILSKPVTVDDLNKAIAKALQASGQ